MCWALDDGKRQNEAAAGEQKRPPAAAVQAASHCRACSRTCDQEIMLSVVTYTLTSTTPAPALERQLNIVAVDGGHVKKVTNCCAATQGGATALSATVTHI